MQEKLYQWILRQNEGGARVTAADVVAYLQVLLIAYTFNLMILWFYASYLTCIYNIWYIIAFSLPFSIITNRARKVSLFLCVCVCVCFLALTATYIVYSSIALLPCMSN